MRKIILGVIFSVLIIIIFPGCDAHQEAKGTVIDKDTKQPIDSVSIGPTEQEDTSYSYSKKTYTNNKGEFYFFRITSSCSFELFFNKQGYKVLKVSYDNPERNDTLYLEKIK